jgi:hypothetical protein
MESNRWCNDSRNAVVVTGMNDGVHHRSHVVLQDPELATVWYTSWVGQPSRKVVQVSIEGASFGG